MSSLKLRTCRKAKTKSNHSMSWCMANPSSEHLRHLLFSVKYFNATISLHRRLENVLQHGCITDNLILRNDSPLIGLHDRVETLYDAKPLSLELELITSTTCQIWWRCHLWTYLHENVNALYIKYNIVSIENHSIRNGNRAQYTCHLKHRDKPVTCEQMCVTTIKDQPYFIEL